MKKTLILIISTIMMLSVLSISALALDITIESPSDSETEIMPGRDFYVVGKINRNNEKAINNPVNIRIELFDERGNVVRSLFSNVGANGVTDAQYFMTDYENGSSSEDAKGTNILRFTPPDIIFDSTARDSIRNAHLKIVVKEDYYAAVIYGGATKEFDLKYTDAYESPLSDIAPGKYMLQVTAVNSDGVDIATSKKTLTFANNKDRLIVSENVMDLSPFMHSSTAVTSVAGRWAPASFLVDNTTYEYIIPGRYLLNMVKEYSEANSVGIMLYDINMNNIVTNYQMGSAFSKASQSVKKYYYYDIGEKEITYDFNGVSLVKTGSIVEAETNEFVKILRAETHSSDRTNYMDFSANDGFVLTKGNATTFYGVYSPMITDTALSGSSYKLNDKVSAIKIVVSDQNEVLYEASCNPYLIRGDSTQTSRYEFKFEITPDSKLVNSTNLTMTVILCDADGNELVYSSPYTVKVNNSGNFIGGFLDTYWGKDFCNIVNNLGQNPSGVALNADDYITRGDFAAMINRLFGFSVEGTNTFTDLQENDIFYSDCLTAQGIGYMSGDEHSRIKANDLISREEAIIILARISKAQMGDKNINFIDREQISFWAEEYVNIMCSNGIVTGFEGYLHPTDSITVAEASALIIKTIKWMYANPLETSTDKIEDEPVTDVGNYDLSEVEFISTVNIDTLSAFYTDNSEVFTSLTAYLQRNCLYGAYVGKVGNGLEMRDYHMGNYLELSENSVNIITEIASKFAVFSIKYNPTNENAIYFTFGKTENGKDVGIAYSIVGEAKGKSLTAIDNNWYYFIQE